MSVAVWLLVASAAAPTRGAFEHQVRERFERIGRSAPTVEAPLSLAAERLAKLALETDVDTASGILQVTHAVSEAQGWDANPTTVIVRARPEQLAKALDDEQSLAAEPASVFGVGLAGSAEKSAVAIVLAQRHVELDAFPRALKKPAAAAPLCFTLDRDFGSPQVFVTRPSGAVDALTVTAQGEKRCAQVPFPVTGRHAVELLARGPRGPEVVALFFVNVGDVKADPLAGIAPEPSTAAEARAQVLERTNALRGSQHVDALAADSALDAVAQAYADRMAKEGFFGHVAPDGVDLSHRLEALRYPYDRAGENLGMAKGPVAAHFGIEHSPGHRKNLLEPAYTVLGVGLAKNASGNTLLVEVLAKPVEVSTDPLEDAYSAIEKARKQKGLPKLSKSPVLESLALEHAALALKEDLPKTVLPGKRRLHDRAFELLDTAAAVSVDLFVAQAPTAITQSKNLVDAKNALVGVGLVKGDSPKYGPGRYWIVVVYASTRE